MNQEGRVTTERGRHVLLIGLDLISSSHPHQYPQIAFYERTASLAIVSRDIVRT